MRCDLCGHVGAQEYDRGRLCYACVGEKYKCKECALWIDNECRSMSSDFTGFTPGAEEKACMFFTEREDD